MKVPRAIRKKTFPLWRKIAHRLHPGVGAGGRPPGFFSERDAVARGEVEGGVLDPSPFPEFPAGSEIVGAGLRQDRFRDWPAVWSHRGSALLVAPTFVHLDASGRVCDEAIYGEHRWRDPVWTRSGGGGRRIIDGSLTSVVSLWTAGGNYYHWFLDGLTRLVHLSSFPADCRVLVPAGLPGFAADSLARLGLADRILEVDSRDIVAEDYWFAGPTMLSGCPDPIGVRWLRERLAMPSAGPGRRLFLSRRATTRMARNESQARRLLEGLGWEAVDPAELDLGAQIRLFGEAEMVAGVHGAAFTNLLWMPAGGAVLEIMPSRRRNGCYAGIALMAGLRHETLVQPSDRSGAMDIDLRALEETVTTRMERQENGRERE